MGSNRPEFLGSRQCGIIHNLPFIGLECAYSTAKGGPTNGAERLAAQRRLGRSLALPECFDFRNCVMPSRTSDSSAACQSTLIIGLSEAGSQLLSV